MRVLTGKKWREGFLDYHRNKKEYRIRVLAWKNLERLENVYHTRAKSLRLLMNYLPVVGPEGMLTKVWSRLREERRNEKYIACGIGKILEAADDENFAVGEIVAFVAPWHPALVERIVLPGNLIFRIEKLSELSDDEILYIPLAGDKRENVWWKKVKAWSVYSGIEISTETRKQIEEELKAEIKNT
ncbi:MAG: hypothetical protein AAB935_00870, partial [Patescibacteria group bacterium]